MHKRIQMTVFVMFRLVLVALSRRYVCVHHVALSPGVWCLIRNMLYPSSVWADVYVAP